MHMNVRALLYWNLPNYELLSQCGRAHRESIAITLGSGTSPSTPEYIGHSICQSVVGITAMQCDAKWDILRRCTGQFIQRHSDCTLYIHTCMYLYARSCRSLNPTASGVESHSLPLSTLIFAFFCCLVLNKRIIASGSGGSGLILHLKRYNGRYNTRCILRGYTIVL